MVQIIPGNNENVWVIKIDFISHMVQIIQVQYASNQILLPALYPTWFR